MTSLHSDLVGLSIHHPFHYEQAGDPGAVGAGKFWLDTTAVPYIIKRRNTGNTGWEVVGGSGGSSSSGMGPPGPPGEDGDPGPMGPPGPAGAGSSGPASQLDANGTTLDVNVITDGEYLKRVGTTVVSGTPSGGSAVYNPFEPLGSPNVMDDEFADGSGQSGIINGLDAKWAWRNQSTAAFTFPHVGVGKLAVPASASGNYRMIEQAVAAGDFSFVAYFTLQGILADFISGGLAVIDRTNGDFYVLGINSGATGTLTSGTSLTVARFTDVNTFLSNLSAFTFGPTAVWMRVDRVGTTLNFYYSTDGVAWNRTASFTDAVNVNGVALAVNETNNSGVSAGHFRAFRRLV